MSGPGRRGRSRATVDLLVVGAGAAGLSAALEASPLRVRVLTKTRLGPGGATAMAQGGVAAAVGEDDSVADHVADTLAVAGGMGDPGMAALLAREGPSQVARLVELGARLDLDETGRLALGREAGHRHRRIVHARDGTGAEIARTLAAAVRAAPHVEVEEGTQVLDLFVEDGRVSGVLRSTPAGEVILERARGVVLATGGAGRLYARTTNPPEATGDGLAMAARAGALLVDLEFVQFHPTALAVAADPMPLLTEALRGQGARLVDGGGRRFLPEGELDCGELAPRDRLARVLWERQMVGLDSFLDAREISGEDLRRRFPTVFSLCQSHGLDPRRDLLPVTPAAHYHMGGVWTGAAGRTSLPGLWACGEVASTGAHGANRLASNSLLEALAFGQRVGRDVRAALDGLSNPSALASAAGRRALAAARRKAKGRGDGRAVEHSLRDLMWRRVGLVRWEAGLEEALRGLSTLELEEEAAPSHELRNLLLVGRLVTTAALLRRDSRGAHFRRDAPHPHPSFQRRILLGRGPDGAWREAAGPNAMPLAAAGGRR